VTDFQPVPLIDPDGNPHIAMSATELTELMYGAGYRPKDNKSADEVLFESTGLGKKTSGRSTKSHEQKES
jgi:hypothetical protein